MDAWGFRPSVAFLSVASLAAATFLAVGGAHATRNEESTNSHPVAAGRSLASLAEGTRPLAPPPRVVDGPRLLHRVEWYRASLRGARAWPLARHGASAMVQSPCSVRLQHAFNLGPVQPELTRIVAVLAPTFRIEVVGGYRASARDPRGHPAGLAADFMVPLTDEGRARGDRLAAFAISHAGELGIEYLVWQQRIWSASRRAEGWRPLTDRGSTTANHLDHVHVQVVAGGPAHC